MNKLIFLSCFIFTLVGADNIIFLDDKGSSAKSMQHFEAKKIEKQKQDDNEKNFEDENAGIKKEYVLPSDMTSLDSKNDTLALSVETLHITKMYDVVNGSTFIAISNKGNQSILNLGGKVFPWIPHPSDSTKQIAYVPIGYHASKGKVRISNNLELNIIEGNYKKENITITNTSKVKPNKEQSDRIARELKEANAIYRTYDKKRYWNKAFIYPINSIITSPFGSARVLNGEIKSYHGGTDFRAAIGTPIKATNDGIVVIAKDRFLAGKSVVISHGEGLFSMYYHLSKINVKVGDKVSRGDIIALSGDSGRVSGAHLHFGIMINGIQVNPLQFIEEINKLFVEVDS